ncbi:GNAT family N-acetyltransferase [Streptomyces sp. NPDC058145]|uniref:GNAT family N-acetyltransferase n=1 Tax=Streptomyces sp. NPDC058145 TaxID=3346356 RepID=UPI0036E8C4F1
MRPRHSSSPAAAGRLHAREYGGQQALDFLARRWAALTEQDAQATAYQDPGWLLAWARHLPVGHEPLVAAIWDDEQPVAALALVREHACSGRTRITPLSWPASEQIRPVGESEQAVRVRVDRLPCLADDVHVADLPDSCLLARHAHAQWGDSDAQTLYATVPLPVDLSALSRSTRREHRRRRRLVQALGDRVAYRTSTRTDLLAAFDVLEDLHHRRNALRLPTTCAADLTLPWRQVLEECPEAALVATLTLDAEPVAAQLCLTRRDRAYSLITAMDPAHRDLSPGHALLYFLCDDLTAQGYAALDLGGTTAHDGQRAYKAPHGATWTTTRTYTPPVVLNSAKEFSSAAKSSACSSAAQ